MNIVEKKSGTFTKKSNKIFLYRYQGSRSTPGDLPSVESTGGIIGLTSFSCCWYSTAYMYFHIKTELLCKVECSLAQGLEIKKNAFCNFHFFFKSL